MRLVAPAVVRVAHDNAVIEAGIRHILGAFPEFRIEPPAGSSPFDEALAGGPDLRVASHDGGLAWARDHQFSSARTQVMVIAMAPQEADVRCALEAGIRGYVLVGCAEHEIVAAARNVAAGRRHLCSTASLRMADSLSQPALTLREGDVLALVFRGLNNKEVARSLDISVGTVKSHLRGLMAKLGARCRTEALWIASQRGLILRADEANATRPQASRRMSADPHVSRQDDPMSSQGRMPALWPTVPDSHGSTAGLLASSRAS